MSKAAPLAPTETEQKLLEIWQSVLETPSIELDDDFLELGGDSLSAMMCISRVRKIFNYDLGIEEFFLDSATIRRFALIIDTAHTEKRAVLQESHDHNVT